MYHKDVVEYHCGRLQGHTRKQALAICKEEGITYETFRGQGGAEVPYLFVNILRSSQEKQFTFGWTNSGKQRFFRYGKQIQQF